MPKAMRIFLAMLVLALVAEGGILLWQRWQVRSHATASTRPLDPAFIRLTPRETATLPLASRFDMPLGSEHGALTYNARSFRMQRHLGDDLNGIGGGNSDLGDPVHASGDGRVLYAGTPHESWGRMIILGHRVPAGDELGPVVQTMYAHLQKIDVNVGDVVGRGRVIGTVGTSQSAPLAHLHFEVRVGPYVNPGQGYADTPLNRVSPEAFIRSRRGARPDVLNHSPFLKDR